MAKNKRGISFKKKCKRKGNAVTFLYTKVGTECPCTDNIYKRYDKAWHRANPDAEDCKGTGFLARDKEVTLKAFIVPSTDSFETINYTQAGTYSKDDLVIFFPYDTEIKDIKSVLFQEQEYLLDNIQKYVLQDFLICYKAELRLKVVE